MNTPEYLSIIENIKSEIKAAQYRATIMTLELLSTNTKPGEINSLIISPMTFGWLFQREKDILSEI